MAQQTDHGGEIWTTSPEIFRFGRSGTLLFRPGTLLFRVSTSAALAVARSARHSTVAERPHRHRPHRLLRVGGCARCAPTRRGAPRAAAGLESPHLARVVGGCRGKAARASPEGPSGVQGGGRAHTPLSRRPARAPAPGYHLAAIDSSRRGTRVARGARPRLSGGRGAGSQARCGGLPRPGEAPNQTWSPRAGARSRAWCSLVPRRALLATLGKEIFSAGRARRAVREPGADCVIHVCAEGFGAVPRGCGKVSGSRGLHKDVAWASQSQKPCS